MLASLLLFTGLVSTALGHGALEKPPSRSTMWRHGFDNPPNYNDWELNCGGYKHHWEEQGGKCGECGDPYDVPLGERENQAGGLYANGIIVDTYQPGQVINVTIYVRQNHLGWFEFRLCENNDPSKPITQECLEEHLLEYEDGTTRWTFPDSKNDHYYFRLRLPEGVTCTQCVLQWKWVCGNRWGCNDPVNETGCCTGCGEEQEHFYGCADIAIERQPYQV